MATVENDPVPTTVLPITIVDSASVPAPPQTPAVDALGPYVGEDQRPDSMNTQLPADDDTTSPPEVTKLPPDQLDIVADALFEAKKLMDTTESTIVDDGGNDSKAKEQEDAATIHAKDSTADTNISDATTVVAEHETEDTLKDDVRNDTQHEGVGATITEETPIGSAASHDTVTEANPGAEEALPTAEISTSESEPVAGSVTEDDPIVSTAKGTETPITEPGPSEAVQPEADETSDLPEVTPTADSDQINDRQTSTGIDEVNSIDNNDHKTEIEEEPTETEDQIVVSTQEVDGGEQVAGITIEAPEEEQTELEQPSPVVQIEGTENGSVEAPIHDSLHVEEGSNIAVEIVAPTPALVDDLDLEASDAEGSTIQSEDFSAPSTTAGEELASTGTVTPHPEPEVDVSLTTVGDRAIAQEEVGESGVVADAPVVEAPSNVEDDVPTPTTAAAAVEVIDVAHDSKEAPETEETSPEVVPVAEAEPDVGVPETETAPVVDPTPETSAETVKDEPAAEEAAPTPVPDEQAVEPLTLEAGAEAVPVPETSIAEEVPDTDMSVVAPEIEASSAEETPVAEEAAPADEVVEPKEVEEQREDIVEDSSNAEESLVESTQAIEEPVVEVVTEAQKTGSQVEEEIAESVEEQEPLIPEVPIAQEESNPATLDEDPPSAQEATEQVPVTEESATDDAGFEEAEPVVSEEPVKVFASEPLAGEEAVGEVNAGEEALGEKPAEGESTEEPIAEEPIVEPVAVNEAVSDASLAESPQVTASGVAEDVVVEKGELTTEEAPAPEPGLETPAFSQSEVAVEEPVVEEMVTDEPTLDVSVPVEEKPIEEPVIEAVAEDGAVGEPIVADTVVQPVGEEPAEVPDVEIPTPPEEPASAQIQSVVEEEPAAELPAASDEPGVQEDLVAEEKPFEEGVYAEEEELQIPVAEEPVNPEVSSPNVMESADVDKRTAEIDTLDEAADPVPVEKQAPSDVVESSGEPSLDDSPAENRTSESNTITEIVAVPEVIVEGEKESNELVFDEFVVKNTPVVEVEAAEGTVTPEKPTLNILEDTPHAERPKSPWTPSFQVTTIGQGASLPPDEDIPIPSPNNDVGEAKDVPVAQPAIIVESTEASADEVQAPAEQTGEPESTSLSWTPSYSVHSQGSPSPTHASLEPETHAVDNIQSEAPSTHDESPVVFEETVKVADKDTGPSMDTETTEPQLVTEEEPKADHPQIADNFEPPHELQTMDIVVPAVEEPETRVEAPFQEEGQDKEPAALHASAIEESFVEDLSSLTPPTEQDRPASPSWVPSYSVSQQGSPLPQQSSLPITDTHIPEPELASDPTLVPDGVVSNDEGVQEDILFASPTVNVNDTQPEGVKQDTQTEEDRPSTPWTPSYSVTHQGADILKETQIQSLTPPGQPKEPEAQLRRSLSEEMEGSSAFSPTALIGAGVAGDAAVLAASATFGGSKDTQHDRNTKLKRSENTSEEPTRATPGEENSFYYDKELKRWVNKVTLPTSLHGSKNEPPANGKAENLSEPLQDKVFPTIEIPGDATKPNTTLLPPLDENNALDTTAPLSPESSPILSRKRLESTTSSRLFPGGWFSNTSQIPDERTSLEVAEGVFSGVKQGTTVEDTLPSPAVDPITPVREHSSSDKRRWCIIM